MKDLFISTSAIKTQPINAFEGRQIEAIPKARFINLLTWIQERVDNGDITGVGGGGSSLPTQTGNNGKFLTTNGTAASWSEALAVAASKVLTVNNTLTFTGTDSSSVAFGTGGNVAYQNQVNTFTQNQILNLPTLINAEATNGINITQTWNTTGSPTILDIDATISGTPGTNARLFSIRSGASNRLSLSPSGQLFLGGTGLVNIFTSVTNSMAPGATGHYIGIISGFNRDHVNYGTTITTPAMLFNVNPQTTGGIAGGLSVRPGTFTIAYTGANTVDFRGIDVAYTINNTTANSRTATGIFLNATETALNGMTHNLMDLQVGGTSLFRVGRLGSVNVGSSLTTGSFISSGSQIATTYASQASVPALTTTGTWFTGGTSTTTKPHVLIEPTGATSTAWSSNGTGLGINAASGFSGNLFDFQFNGVSVFRGNTSGQLVTTGTVTVGGNMNGSGNVLGGLTGFIGIANRTGFNSSAAGLFNITNQNDNNFERLQLGGATSLFPALQIASSNTQTGLAATFTNGSANIITVANTFAANDVVQFTGTVPSGFATGTNYFIVGTPTSTQTGLTATFTNGNANIVTTANNYSAGDVVQFTSTGTLPTGFALATNYYVIATGLTTTNIQVSATLGGAAITAASAGSGVQTVTRQPMFTVSATSGGAAITAASAGTAPWTVVRQTSATITNGSSTWTSTFVHGLRVGDVIRLSGAALPTGFVINTDYYVLTAPSTTTFTLSPNFGGTVVTASSAVTTAIVFTRSPGIYVRNGDNSAYSQLYSGNIVANAPSGFTGNLLDLQLNGASRFSVSSTGVVLASSSIASSGNFVLQSSSNFVGSGNGVMRITNINFNDYERLQFGSTTSASPALQIASSNTQTGLAATFTNASANIGTATNTFAANDVVQFTTTGTLPTNFATATNYFVIATSLSTINIQVSATQGGTAISAGSAGSGTHTVVRQNTCIFTNGSSTVTTASAHTLRVGDVIRFSNSGGSLPSSLSTAQDYYILSTASTTFTFGNFFGGTAITPPETGVTATFAGTPNITTTANTYVAGSVVRFTTTGTLPTGLATGTDYFVIATSLSTTNIQVSATLGGTAIAYTGTGSGTHTVARQILGNGIQFFTRLPGIYVRTADNTAHADLLTRTISINAPTGFAGNAIDLKIGTSSVFNVSNAGNITTNGSVLSGGNIRAGAANGIGWSGSSSDMVNTFNGGIRMTNSSAADFYQLQFGNGTTSPSFVTFTPVSTTATFTAASATIGASPVLALRAGDVVQFSNSGGALPPEIISGRNYYVLASGLSATTIQVAESLGGTAIVPSTVGTGTHTTSRITGISLRNSPNTALVAQESLYQRFGAGTPEGVVTAPVGATYNRTDGSAGTSFYVKESGTGNTGWVAK